MIKKRTLMLGLVCLLASSVVAQRSISGIVIDEQGQALIGAAVIIKGTSTGSITDIDGSYSISVPREYKKLVFSYTGYETQEITLGISNTLGIEMKPGILLEEIVVTGQGIGLERKRLASTVDVIYARDLELAPITQLDQILQSRIPGLQVQLSSGQPGTSSIIRSRGLLSAIAASTPVILIDGIRIDNLNSRPFLNVATGGANSSALADISVESIEKIEFIRGGAATTLYGADAANGVIQIFTRKGTSGKASFFYDGTIGNIQGEKTFLRFPETADLLYQTGAIHQHRIGAEGGNDQTSYRFSGSFYDDDGFNAINKQRRLSFRTSLRAKVKPDLTYTGTAAFTSNFFTRDYNANSVFSRYGNTEGGLYGDISLVSEGFLDSLKNQLQMQADYTDITEAIRRFQTAHSFEWQPVKTLMVRATFGLDNRRSRAKEIASNALLIAKEAASPDADQLGSLNLATREFLTVTTELNLQHRFVTNDFSFISGAGGQFFREQEEQYQIIASQLAEGASSINFAASHAAQDYLTTAVLGGFFFSENVGYKNKIFLDAAIRFDGNSAFGESLGLQNTYRFGLAYSLTDEAFMQTESTAKIINKIRFRANFGQSTNFPSPFARDRTFEARPYLEGIALFPSNPGNAMLGPERIDSYEIGADMSFVDARFGLNFTYYNTKTVDAIFTPPAIPSSGQFSQEMNVGSISNKGFEVQTFLQIVKTQDIDFTINGSLTTNKNQVLDAGGTPEFAVGGFSFLGSYIKEGLPLGYFRGSRPVFNANGELVEVEENAVLGDPNPDAYGIFGLQFRWKNTLFFVSGDYQMGAQAIAVDDVLRYFEGIPDIGRLPENANEASFFDLAGLWVEDADYIKIRNIGLTYEVPVEQSILSRLRIGISLRNPWVHARSSFDPEASGAGISAQNGFGNGGYNFGTQSQAKQVLFNVLAQF